MNHLCQGSMVKMMMLGSSWLAFAAFQGIPV
jgi:hypothetical protein